MGSRFLLSFFTLSALFLILHARAGGWGFGSEPGPRIWRIRARALLQQPEQGIADPPRVTANGDGERRESAAEAPTVLDGGELGRHHSVVGGGVVIGGLVTAVLAAVYCYIRVTRKRRAVNGG
ncbi:serinc-domain containing serine and sphingolipidbiosynthesis protein [Striga asiatica]|uniref:Serinc-domain containing serine and sphingolipidbiosynthesis protein n=1 Tax=Striga asiatica TaxID=4170 RepID=A0A5A7R6E2_STRAF|nr:serinc-domain containing serine and sphingolipidbiosynthesis protein [Striga asiatica]